MIWVGVFASQPAQSQNDLHRTDRNAANVADSSVKSKQNNATEV